MTQQGRSGGFFDAECREQFELLRGGRADAGEALLAELDAVFLQPA